MESAGLLKVTLMMATALKHKKFQIVPYHVLELPEKKPGHPYVADMIIKGSKTESSSLTDKSVEEPVATDEQPAIATISYNKSVIMIIEFKKVVSPSIKLVVTNDLVEMIIYCRYITDIRNLKQKRQQGTIIGV